MYLVKTPELLKPLAKDLLWHIDTSEKEIFLTFDDGPTPEVTELVLDLLHTYHAQATFFCLGKNVTQYPFIYNRILREGHSVGNHTFNHPDGWKTPVFSYLRDILLAKEHIHSQLFRPPYGRITPGQVAALKKKFTLVMWDVLSADFDQTIKPTRCLTHVLTHAKQGSIIVFHDSEKAKRNMLFALEGTLRELSSQGYIFRALKQA